MILPARPSSPACQLASSERSSLARSSVAGWPRRSGGAQASPSHSLGDSLPLGACSPDRRSLPKSYNTQILASGLESGVGLPDTRAETDSFKHTRDGGTIRVRSSRMRNVIIGARDFEICSVRGRQCLLTPSIGNFLYEDRAECAHEAFPELRDYIANNYHLVRDVEGTRIYVRNDRL